MNKQANIPLCVGVLELLSQRGLCRITHIMYELNANCNSLKSQLSFMEEQGLVEKKPIEKKRIGYSITKQGSIILNSFNEVKEYSVS